MRTRVKTIVLLTFLSLFLIPLAAHGALSLFEDRAASWRNADWSSTGTLPAASAHPEARVIIMSARTGRWKGIFSVHSWIVLKGKNAKSWTRYDVVGWGSPVRTNGWAPDSRWYGDTPTAVADVQGAAAEALIPKMKAAIEGYQFAHAGDYRIWPGPNSNTFVATILRAVPELGAVLPPNAIEGYQFAHAGDYRIWPGPNSNTFVATILRAVPELGAVLPPNAIGKDFRPSPYLGWSDSGTGVEASLWGLAGIKAGWVEGLEINLFSLVVGIDLRHPALKLPGFGRLGFAS